MYNSRQMDNQPKKGSFWRDAWLLIKVLSWCVAGLIAVVLCLIGFDNIDSQGYIVHHKTVDLYMSGDWIVGEHRDCVLAEIYDDNQRPTGAILNLACPVEAIDGAASPHNVNVAFWGPLRHQEMGGAVRPLPVLWKCTRESFGFTCELPSKD